MLMFFLPDVFAALRELFYFCEDDCFATEDQILISHPTKSSCKFVIGIHEK